MRTLYICYFGLREPLVQTQVLPYLREICRGEGNIGLLTFEPYYRRSWSRQQLRATQEELETQGITWFALPYHKQPTLPATLYDIARGAWFVLRIIRRNGIRVLHARGHVSAAMGALAKVFGDGLLIFDIRGFMPEEYTDAGVWPEGGYLYRLTKAVESRLLDASDAFVVLTEKARSILFGNSTEADSLGRPIEVIPCCIDPERFWKADDVPRGQLRQELSIDDRHVIIYVGALGGWYLVDEMADFMAAAHRRNAATYSIILSQSTPEMMRSRLRERGVAEKDFLVRQVIPTEVPRYIRAADLALSFIKPCYSKQSSSPTKIAEYLAGGVPIICNAGIGDVDEVIETDRVGVVLTEFSEPAYLRALEAVDSLRSEVGLAERCRAVAGRRFHLGEVAGVRYRRLYQRLGS